MLFSRSFSQVKQVCLASVAVLSTLGLLSCSSGKPVACYGVSKQGAEKPILMSSGLCRKLAYAKAKPATEAQVKAMHPYSYDSYVKCYGVAAANMNDCGTKTSACGGSIHVDGSKDAWIAIPKGICEQIKNGIVVIPKKNKHEG
jgi:uncharacterized membrane protein